MPICKKKKIQVKLNHPHKIKMKHFFFKYNNKCNTYVGFVLVDLRNNNVYNTTDHKNEVSRVPRVAEVVLKLIK